MCIIVVKKSKVAMPTKEILHNCYLSNVDGMGYMFTRSNEIHIKKGFLDFETFFASVKSDKLTVTDTVIFHFRIATSGLVNASNTHPFPITKNVKLLMNNNLICDTAVAHNGILGLGEKHLSDTMVFIRDILSENPIKFNLRNSAVQTLITSYLRGDKLVILFKNSDIILFGDWVSENGLMFSNSTYKLPPYLFSVTDDKTKGKYLKKEKHKSKKQTVYDDIYGRYGKAYGSYNDCWEDYSLGNTVCPICKDGILISISHNNDLVECGSCYAVLNSQNEIIYDSDSYPSDLLKSGLGVDDDDGEEGSPRCE